MENFIFFVQCKFWSEYLELISCIVLVSSGTEAYNLIQLPLFVSEWPHWPLNSKGFTFYIKLNAFIHRRLKCFETSNPFFKECSFYQLQHFFSLLIGFCLSWYSYFKHISLLDLNILSFNIWRQKYKSIRSSNLKPQPRTSESPIIFPKSKKPLNDWYGLKWMCLLKVSKNLQAWGLQLY